MKKSSFKIEFRIRKRFSVTAEEGISLFVHKSVKENAETISLPLLKNFLYIIINTIASIFNKTMPIYLFLEIICSSSRNK